MGMENSWEQAAKRTSTEHIEERRNDELRRSAEMRRMSVADLKSLERKSLGEVGSGEFEIAGRVNGVEVRVSGNIDGRHDARGTLNGYELRERDALLVFHNLNLAISGREHIDSMAFDDTTAAIDDEENYMTNVEPLVWKVLEGRQSAESKAA